MCLLNVVIRIVILLFRVSIYMYMSKLVTVQKVRSTCMCVSKYILCKLWIFRTIIYSRE